MVFIVKLANKTFSCGLKMTGFSRLPQRKWLKDRKTLDYYEICSFSVNYRPVMFYNVGHDFDYKTFFQILDICSDVKKRR